MTTVDEFFGDMEAGTLITCPVCRENFNLAERSPLTIPCGHTVCKHCSVLLLPQHGTPMMYCPVCRKRHYGQSQGGVCSFDFPKNYQLLEVVERVLKIKQDGERKRSERRFVKCIECEAQVLEQSCTTCSCIRGPSCNDFDFMERPKNKLICIDCVLARHKGGDHDSKPMEAVKAASDNFMMLNNLKEAFEKIKQKTEGAQASLNNCREELDSVIQEMNKVMNHINEAATAPGNNKDTYCKAAKFTCKLQEWDITITNIGKAAHKDASSLGEHAKAIKECLSAAAAAPSAAVPAEQPRQRLWHEMRMGDGPFARHAIAHHVAQAQARPPQRRQAPAAPAAAEPEEVVVENQVREAENVQIFVHMRDGGERERHVRDAMEQFIADNPDAIGIGNGPGAARVIQGGRNDERLNGLVRGIFDFVDGVMAGERANRNGNNGGRAAENANAGNDELLDEVALVEQEVVNGAPRQLIRRRVQVRLRIQPPVEERAVPAEEPQQEARAVQAEEPQQEDVEMEVVPVEEQPEVAPRRRGRPRGQAARPIARVADRRAEQNAVGARNARRNRRQAARN